MTEKLIINDFYHDLPIHIPIIMETQGEVGRTLPVSFSLTRGNANIIPVHIERPLVTPDRMPIHLVTYSIHALGGLVDGLGRPLPPGTTPRFPIIVRIWNHVVNTIKICAQVTDFIAKAQLTGTSLETRKPSSGDPEPIKLIYAVMPKNTRYTMLRTTLTKLKKKNQVTTFLSIMGPWASRIKMRVITGPLFAKVRLHTNLNRLGALVGRVYGSVRSESRVEGLKVKYQAIVRKLAIVHSNLLSVCLPFIQAIPSQLQAHLPKPVIKRASSLQAHLQSIQYHLKQRMTVRIQQSVLYQTTARLLTDLRPIVQKRVARLLTDLRPIVQKRAAQLRIDLTDKISAAQSVLSRIVRREITVRSKCQAMIREYVKREYNLRAYLRNALITATSRVKVDLRTNILQRSAKLRVYASNILRSSFLQAIIKPVEIEKVLAWIRIWPKWKKTVHKLLYSAHALKTVTVNIVASGNIVTRFKNLQFRSYIVTHFKNLQFKSYIITRFKSLQFNSYYAKVKQSLVFVAKKAVSKVDLVLRPLLNRLRKWLSIEPMTARVEERLFIQPQIKAHQQRLVHLFLHKAQQRARIQWWVRSIDLDTDGYAMEIVFDLDERGIGIGPMPPTGIESWTGGYVEYPFLGMGMESLEEASGYMSPEGEQWVKNAAMLWQTPTNIFEEDGDE